MSCTLAISAANQLAELPRVAGEVDAWLVGAGLPHDTIDTVHLVLDELLSNVVRWAYDDGEVHTIEVGVALEPDGLLMTIEDDGRAFDPLAAPAPDLQAPPDRRPEGGLGIHFVRTLADRVDYRRVDGRNVVRTFFRTVP